MRINGMQFSKIDVPAAKRGAAGGGDFIRIGPNGMSLSASLAKKLPADVGILTTNDDTNVLVLTAREKTHTIYQTKGNRLSIIAQSGNVRNRLKELGWSVNDRHMAEEVGEGTFLIRRAGSTVKRKRI